MKTTNIEIREKAMRKGVPLWRIAREFGYTDATFSRKLRTEFSLEDKKKALELIDKIAQEV